jgi:hypothetical protein
VLVLRFVTHIRRRAYCNVCSASFATSPRENKQEPGKNHARTEKEEKRQRREKEFNSDTLDPALDCLAVSRCVSWEIAHRNQLDSDAIMQC